MELKTSAMLKILNSRIVYKDKKEFIVEVQPGITVLVPKGKLRSWCINRINSRKHHKGKACKYSSGAPSGRHEEIVGWRL